MEAVLDDVSGPGQSARWVKDKAPQLVVDPDVVTLARGGIVLKHTDDGGYFCMGFGPSAGFLRAIDDDDRFNEAIDEAAVALGNLSAPIAPNSDPFLHRLGVAVALAKDGFDPDQPRDDHGRWTGEGGGAETLVATASVAESVIEPAKLVPALRQLSARLLSGAASIASDAGAIAADAAEAGSIGVGAATSGAVAFFGTLFIPTNRSLISEGTIPDAPDLGYRFDQGAGVLTLTRTNADGTKETLFQARPGEDSLFRDKDGNVVGRFLGDSVVVDPDVVAGYESRAKDKDRTNASARAQAVPIADTAQPKLCPEPSADKPGNKSPGAIAYQMYVGMVVNGEPLPIGLGIRMTKPDGDPVYFDDCQRTTGILIEAKGKGYLDLLHEGGFLWSRTLGRMFKQANAQIESAQGRPIEWHFAEKEVADYIRPIFAQRYPGIVVIYTAPPPGLIGDLERILKGLEDELGSFRMLLPKRHAGGLRPGDF
jgi:hypothetical protein